MQLKLNFAEYEEELEKDVIELTALWDEEESNRRMKVIGQNGNTGEHYE